MRLERKQLRKILAGKVTEFRLPAHDEARCKHRPGGVIPLYQKGVRTSAGRVIVTRVERDGGEWVVSFVPDRSEPARLLHRDSSRGYTSNRHEALPDEPEAVDEETLKGFGREARAKRERGAEQARREMRSLQGKLREAQSRAIRQGVDISPEITRIQQAIDDAKRRLDKAA